MDKRVLELATADIFEMDEQAFRETALIYLVNPVVGRARIDFLTAIGAPLDNCALNKISDLAGGDMLDALLSGKIPLEQVRNLCVNPEALRHAMQLCQAYHLPIPTPEVPADVKTLINAWRPDGSWLRGIKQSAHALCAFTDRLIAEAENVFVRTFSVPSLSIEGQGASPNAHTPSESTLVDRESPRITADGRVQLTCGQDDAPYQFGLLYIFDDSEEPRPLVQLVPTWLTEADSNYWLDIPLSDLMQKWEGKPTPVFIAASEETSGLFSPAMLTELGKYARNESQLNKLDSFNAMLNARNDQ